MTAGTLRFRARLERGLAPLTCAAVERMLPMHATLLHARWSGEAGWVPFGDLDLALSPENATSYPAPGQLLLYPGGVSETEILVPYGPTCFASKAGQLAGNHFATIIEGEGQFQELGRRLLHEGAQELTLEPLAG
ncbi:MAG: DUF3830 family protein [Gemmatimonadaceae bacterium]